jgi:hypothetical protein
MKTILDYVLEVAISSAFHTRQKRIDAFLSIKETAGFYASVKTYKLNKWSWSLLGAQDALLLICSLLFMYILPHSYMLVLIKVLC